MNQVDIFAAGMRCSSIPKPMANKERNAFALRAIKGFNVRVQSSRQFFVEFFDIRPRNVISFAETFQQCHGELNVSEDPSQIRCRLVRYVNQRYQVFGAPQSDCVNDLEAISVSMSRVVGRIPVVRKQRLRGDKCGMNAGESDHETGGGNKGEVELLPFALALGVGCQPDGANQSANSSDRAYPGSPVGLVQVICPANQYEDYRNPSEEEHRQYSSAV